MQEWTWDWKHPLLETVGKTRSCGGGVLAQTREVYMSASDDPDQVVAGMAPLPLDDCRMVGSINYETGAISMSYEPIDLITKLARLTDPDAGNEIDVTPPRSNG